MLLSLFLYGFLAYGTPKAEAYYTPHPLEDYEKGLNILQSYHGDDSALIRSEKYFNRIIDKHPDSPLGYLGLSQLKTLEAYRYGKHYNIKLISEEAMPMALKALRAGPTLPTVHRNYDGFEQIFKNNDENQDHIKILLALFPEKPETYFSLGNYLTDQGDYEKALEYFKLALRFSERDEEKLKLNLRIARIYYSEVREPRKASQYYEAALAINKNLPSVWESLGKIYFDLQEYDLSVENFRKALTVFETHELRCLLAQAQGQVYARQGKLDKAIESINRAISENTQNSTLLSQLGNLYYRKSDFRQAFEHFKQAIEGGLADPESYYMAGRAAYTLGEIQVARDFCSKYLQLRSDGNEAKWIRDNFPELSHR